MRVCVAHCANSVTEVIKGAHTILYAREPERTREFLATVLGLESVDAGGGWLIFALPPAELACHPAETGGTAQTGGTAEPGRGAEPGGTAELYLMCEDLDATRVELERKGARLGPERGLRWGRIAPLTIPGFGEIGVYEPRHASPLDPFRT